MNHETKTIQPHYVVNQTDHYGCPTISQDEAWANARLIAAAPDLLAALKRAVETMRALHDIGLIGSPHAADEMWALYQQSPEMQAIHAAIAKAEGRTEIA